MIQTRSPSEFSCLSEYTRPYQMTTYREVTTIDEIHQLVSGRIIATVEVISGGKMVTCCPIIECGLKCKRYIQITGPREGWGQRVWIHPEKSQKYSFFAKFDPDPLQITKLSALKTITQINVGPSSARKRNADGGPFIVVFGSLSPNQLKKSQSWTPSDKTFWIRACNLFSSFFPNGFFHISSYILKDFENHHPD